MNFRVLVLIALAPVCVAQSPSGETASGQKVFQGKGNCLSCHRVSDQGSYIGPDLSAIGTAKSSEEIRKAIVAPSAIVASTNKLYEVVTQDGKAIRGRLLNQDTSTVQMLATDERLVTLKKAMMKSRGFVVPPPMPSYADKLTGVELNDLIAYLATLQGVVKQ